MSRVKTDSPLSVIYRRKWTIIITTVVVVLVTGIVSQVLPKVYETQATLLVALPADTQSFDSVQASQAIARSYADIIESPNIAQLVSSRLGAGFPRSRVASETSFEPVAQTQLLKVSVADRSAADAKRIADTYAVVFIDYARRNLARTTGATISLADAAPLKRTAARPKPALYTMVALVLGIVLGTALAFLVERLDRRLRTADDVESKFDVPVLARVPRRGRSDSSITAFKESMRILRTNLQFAGGARELRSIAITSAGEGEGKTTTVANLAVASAEVGQHVIIVEADLRRPALQSEILPEHTTPLRPGFSNYLVETVPLEHCIFPAGKPGVDILPAGPLPPSPSALLESRRGQTAVAELGARFDLTLIDCPPLSVGADASIITGWVDGVIVVVDLQGSTDQSLRQALRQLEAVKAPVIGLLINRDRSAEATRYDYYTALPPQENGSKTRGRATSGSRRS